MLPVLRTTYVQLTAPPTVTTGPVGVSASSPFVYFSTSIPDTTPK